MMFPAKFIGVCEMNVGTSRPAVKIEANTMYGVAVKIQEVVVEITGCLWNSLAKSAYG